MLEFEFFPSSKFLLLLFLTCFAFVSVGGSLSYFWAGIPSVNAEIALNVGGLTTALTTWFSGQEYQHKKNPFKHLPTIGVSRTVERLLEGWNRFAVFGGLVLCFYSVWRFAENFHTLSESKTVLLKRGQPKEEPKTRQS